MIEKLIVIALAFSYLLDRKVERQRRLAEIEKLKLETKKLALSIKKEASK